jgi:hypothetical protein
MSGDRETFAASCKEILSLDGDNVVVFTSHQPKWLRLHPLRQCRQWLGKLLYGGAAHPSSSSRGGNGGMQNPQTLVYDRVDDAVKLLLTVVYERKKQRVLQNLNV